MGFIANNLVINGKKVEQVEEVKTQPQPVPQRTIKRVTTPVQQPQEPDLKNIDTSQHHILVVNGKQKKLSKRSSYLLDMLEIEEEQ